MSNNSSDNSSDSNSSQFQKYMSSSTGTASTTPANVQQILEGLSFARGGPMGQNGELTDAYNRVKGYGTTALGLYNNNAVPFVQNTLNGAYLNANPANSMLAPIANGSADGRWSNPYADAAFQQGAGQLESASRSAWGGQDTTPGSGGVQQAALGNADANLASQIYLPTAMQERQNQIGAIDQLGANYTNERGLQNQAAGLLPAYTQSMMLPGQAQAAATQGPMASYLQALTSLSPGTNSTKDITTNGTSMGTSTGQTQQSGGGKGINFL